MYEEASEELKKKLEAKPEPSRGLDFGSVLAKLLEGKNVKQFAGETGISRVEIYHILSGRKRYPGLENLRRLARSLGVELWRLVALAEEKKSENIYLGGGEPEFTMQFKKEGVVLSSDTPPNHDLFVGRLILDPGVELSDRLTQNCWVHLRPIATAIEVAFEGKSHHLSVNNKILFNGRLPHRIKNPSKVSKSTVIFITTPSFGALSLTR